MAEIEKKQNPITAAESQKAHAKSDVDSAIYAQHHTLGSSHNQASPGDHVHDGGISRKIASTIILTGSRSGGTALVSVIAALVALGATDSTTA
jgi:hypothetical protein